MRICSILSIVLASGCVDRTYHCRPGDNVQCESQQGAGVCEPTGFCSAADASCESGRRYNEYAGDDLGSTCVVESCLSAAVELGVTPPDANLLAHGTFEPDADLGAWDGSNVSVMFDPVAHCGVRSLRVCAVGADVLFAARTPGLVATAGERLLAAGWVRRAAGATAPSMADVGLREDIATYPQDARSIPIDDTWQPVMLPSYSVINDGVTVQVFVRGMNPVGGECVLLDDVELHHAP